MSGDSDPLKEIRSDLYHFMYGKDMETKKKIAEIIHLINKLRDELLLTDGKKYP